MKYILLFSLLFTAFKIHAETPCEEKVLGYHKAVYHRTYKAASITFLNNFIGRKNTFAHAFGYPEMAFLRMSFNSNFIAEAMIEKAEDKGLTAEAIYETYTDSLKSGELCEALGNNYKKPRKIRAFLFQKLKI